MAVNLLAEPRQPTGEFEQMQRNRRASLMTVFSSPVKLELAGKSNFVLFEANPLKNSSAAPPNLDLRKRRDFVSEQKSWSDLRAWLSSCIFHTILLVVFALLGRSGTFNSSGEKVRPVGIAFAQDTSEGGQFALDGGSSGANSSIAADAQPISLNLDNITGPPLSIEGIVSSLVGDSNGGSGTPTGQNEGVGSGLAGSNGAGAGTGGRGQGRGNKSKASFFGMEGSGSSFAYVVDRSDSMNAYDGAPLRFAKRELIKSLESLNEYNQFQLVFYNDSLSPMSGGMLFATDQGKSRAINFIRNMPGDGGTSHLPALKQALSLAPDVLFFLTDADDPSLTMPQLLDIQRRTEISRTTIHTIQFNSGPASNDGSWIRKMAEMNRGSYKYIDVTSFNKDPGE